MVTSSATVPGLQCLPHPRSTATRNMASAFNWVVKSVIRELDPRRELTAVDSLESASGFQPYHLLMKKLSRQWFGQARYSCINMSLEDVLECSSPEPVNAPAPQHVGTFRFLDLVDGQLQGSLELAAAGQGMLKAGASVSDTASASMQVTKLQVDPRTWAALQQKMRLQKPEPGILQQLRQYGVNVYVVTEALRMESDVEATRTRKQEGSGQLTLTGALSLRGKGQGHLSCKTTVTIPSGSILAFRAALLVIDSDSCDWDVVLFPEKRQRTFRPDRADVYSAPSSQHLDRKHHKLCDGVSRAPTATLPGFLLLEAEVEDQAEGLCILSRELCRQLLRGLDVVLRDEEALQALEESLEQGVCSGHVEKQDGPVASILECLVKPSRELEEELTKHAVYLLGALSALSAAQRALLARELQARALSGPLSLVRSLLQQTDPWLQCRKVTLPQLQRGGWGTDTPAWVLLEQCGLRLQEDAPHVHWVPQALDATHALYASLEVLSRLSRDQ